MSKPTINVKRIYDAPAAADGTRILVDRLWPRGIAKEKAGIDLWLKDIAPSHELRKRFHGKPGDWEAFRAAYFAELESAAAQEVVQALRAHLRKGPVTLLYAARDESHNNAVALKDVNEHEYDHMLAWGGEHGFDLCLIETIPIGESGRDRPDQYLPRAQPSAGDSPGSRWPAGLLSRRPSGVCSSTSR